MMANGRRRRVEPAMVVFIAALAMLGIAVGIVVVRQQRVQAPARPRSHYLDSPYQAQLFHKGQLHALTSRGTGHGFPRDVAHAYQRLGYEWLAVTDLNTLTQVDQVTVPGMTAIRGTEAGFPFGHLLDFGVEEIPVTSSLQQNIDFVHGQAGLTILAHPRVVPAVSLEQALALRPLDAIEVYDARTAREQPELADAVGTWDQLLSAGRRVWGVAGDDSVELEGTGSTIGQTSVDVQAPQLNEALILQAVRSGAFIASVGVRVLGVDTSSGDTIRVITTNGTSIQWYGRGGRLLTTTNGPAGNYHVRWDEGYVRAVALGADGIKAWVQPVFVVP